MIEHHYLIGNAKQTKNIFKKKNLNKPSLIITSPPYFDLLNYNDNKNQIGYGQKDYDTYLDVLTKIFQDCYDVSQSTATLWLVVDTFKKNQELKLLPFDIVNRLKLSYSNTWILKDIVIWDKGKNLPWNTNGNFKNQHEYILFFTKGNKFTFNIDKIREILDLKKWWKTYPERYNPDGKAPGNVWSYNSPIRGWGNSKQNHFCPFPFPLVEKIISLCSHENEWVFDPFAGSGSVLAMAQEMKRNSIGFDVNIEYRKIFKKEVLLGAHRYWSKRQIELLDSAGEIQNFKETNKKLRKLKIASNICLHINKINNHPFVFFTKDKPNNEIELTVLQNGVVPIILLEDEQLKELIKQSKINPVIHIQKDSEFVSQANIQAYRYKFQMFYSYTSSCKIENILDRNDKYDYMYSDIVLKISNN